jgi:hypothetical protein
MNPKQAADTLDVIRTLMERTTQYQLLTARAGLAAGALAGAGALAFTVLDVNDPRQFGATWGLVFLGSLLVTCVSTVLRGRQRGERVWSRQARAVVGALAPSLFAAAVLTVYFFARDAHLWLPGVWMLCYGQGALATATYAPKPIRFFGGAMLLSGAVTLALGPTWSVVLMGIAFGLGHILLGFVLYVVERRQVVLRVHQLVA